MAPKMIFPIFMGTWIVLAVLGALLYRKGDLATKRKWHPRMVIGTGVLFVAFAYAMFPNALTLLIFVPLTTLIQYMNYRFTRFCPSCGKTVRQNPPWGRMEFCPKCGAKLTLPTEFGDG